MKRWSCLQTYFMFSHHHHIPNLIKFQKTVQNHPSLIYHYYVSTINNGNSIYRISTVSFWNSENILDSIPSWPSINGIAPLVCGLYHHPLPNHPHQRISLWICIRHTNKGVVTTTESFCTYKRISPLNFIKQIVNTFSY